MTGQRKTVLGLLVVLLVMSGLTAASVPLYRLFCSITGYEGTTQVAKRMPKHEVASRVITVRFDASRAPDLPWDFEPMVHQVTVHPGEVKIIDYRAVNRSAEPITGRATYNVTPTKAGLYFDKLQCFCFTDQYLAPGQSAILPVQFFVDAGIAKDPDTQDVDTITLSYTFFRATDAGAAAADASGAPPHLN